MLGCIEAESIVELNGLPLMKLIEGRSDSFMQTPDGRVFSPIIWTLIMRQIPGVNKFKAIQERNNYITIKIVKGQVFSSNTIGKIIKSVQGIMGGDIHVDVEIVEEIPRDSSRKLRCAESKVKIKR